MSFTLHVDAERWRTHVHGVNAALQAVTGSTVVPVIKGNGYGLGQAALTRESDSLATDVVAVGTVFELDEVLTHTLSDVVVLEPFEPRDQAAADAWWSASKRWDANRIIRTIASASALDALVSGSGAVRVLLEARTAMHRFGFSEEELVRVLGEPDVGDALSGGHLKVMGLALHMPIAQPADEPRTGTGSARVRQVLRWNALWREQLKPWHGVVDTALWLSHLSDMEYADVRRAQPEVIVRARVGTRLWLGDRGALSARGTVLAVHPLDSHVHAGYRQRSGPSGGTLLVVSGGTAHGIGLAAPSSGASLRQRIVTAGTGALDATGRALSPFHWDGKQRWFAETPHQHHSMIWLPRGCVVPQVGEQLVADVRFTTSRFDAVKGLDN